MATITAAGGYQQITFTITNFSTSEEGYTYTCYYRNTTVSGATSTEAGSTVYQGTGTKLTVTASNLTTPGTYNTSVYITDTKQWVSTGTVQVTSTGYIYLTYNADGGSLGSITSGSRSSTSPTYSGGSWLMNYTLPSSKPTRTGYTFKGWELEQTYPNTVTYSELKQPNTNYSFICTFSSTKPAQYTLTAKWEKQTVYIATITTSGMTGVTNSGTFGTLSGESTTSSTIKITLWSETPSRAGYTFAGWLLSYDKATYSAGASVSVLGSTSGIAYTVTPQWEQYSATINYYTYNGNYLYYDSQSSYTSSSFSFTLPEVPSRTYYTARGWTINSTLYAAGKTFPATGTTSGKTYSAYATYKAKTYTVDATFEFQSPSDEDAKTEIFTNSGNNTVTVTIPNTSTYKPSITGYDFLGWNYNGTYYKAGDSFTITVTDKSPYTTEITLFGEFKQQTYGWKINVYINDDYMSNYSKSGGDTTTTYITLRNKLDSNLLENYEFVSSKSTVSSLDQTINLIQGQTKTIDAYFKEILYAVTLNHQLQDLDDDDSYSLKEETVLSIQKGNTFTPANYKKTYSGFTYNSTDYNGSKITADETYNLYYNRNTYIMTFRHLLNDDSAETIANPTTASFKYGKTFDLSDQKVIVAGYLYDYAEDSQNNRIVSYTVGASTATFYLYYNIHNAEVYISQYLGGYLKERVKYTLPVGSTITSSSYKKDYSSLGCEYHSSNPTSLTIQDIDGQEIKLYYAIKWDNEKTSEKQFNLTAIEWNNLTNYLVLNSKKPEKGFTKVQKDITLFTADIYNEVSGVTNGTTVKPGQIVTAQLMNALISGTNSLFGLN